MINVVTQENRLLPPPIRKQADVQNLVAVRQGEHTQTVCFIIADIIKHSQYVRNTRTVHGSEAEDGL